MKTKLFFFGKLGTDRLVSSRIEFAHNPRYTYAKNYINKNVPVQPR